MTIYCSSKFRIAALVVLFASILFSCHEAAEIDTPKGIRDTVELGLSFVANGTSYSFAMKPGDTHLTNVNQVYGNSGFVSFASNRWISDAASYVKLTDKTQNIIAYVGMAYAPEVPVDDLYHEGCNQLLEDTDSYFLTGEQLLCSTWDGGEVCECNNEERNKFYFQVLFEHLNTGQKFKSGLETVPGSIFKVKKIEKLEYVSEIASDGNFDLLIEGEFTVTLHEYNFPSNEHPEPEALKFDNAKFKLGFRSLCL